MPGKKVQFQANGGTTEGYLSTPESGSGPGVIVVQEWWGLVPHITDVADRFAAEGFVALAPDLYHGQSTEEPDEAGKLMMAMDIDRVAKDLRGAASYLLGEGGAAGNAVGVVGFCMGGQLALYAATVAPDTIGAVVDFYGIHPSATPNFDQLRAPVMGNFAELDEYASPAAVAALEEEIKRRGVETDFKIYEGADHAFFNDERAEVHKPEASQDAWQRTIGWFKKHLHV
jgi:carboxymethylenebutenolidase